MSIDRYLSKLLSRWLKSLGVKVDRDTLHDNLVSHPFYPSVHAVSDLLKVDVNVPNYTLDFKENVQDGVSLLESIPTPFLGMLKNKKQYIIVNSISKGYVEYRDHKEKIKVTEEDFIEKWRGFAMVAFPEDNSGLPMNEGLKMAKYFQWLLLLLFGFITGALLFSLLGNLPSIYLIALLPLKIWGLIIAVNILKQEFEESSNLLNSLCRIGNTDCESLLKSKDGKLFGGILSWAELGFGYFAGGLLLLLLGIVHSEAMILLSVLNICTLVFSIYSLIFQFFIQKKPCAVCLITLAIFGLEFLLFLPFLPLFWPASPYIFLQSLLIFSLPFGAWQLVKPHYRNSISLKDHKKQLNRFKYKSRVFDRLNERFPNLVKNYPGITVYNTGQKNILTLVTNPFCGTCEKVHHDLAEMLKKHLPQTRIDMIFGIVPDDKNSKVYQVTRFMLGIYLLHGVQRFLEVTNHWNNMKDKSLSAIQKAFPVVIDPIASDALVQEHIQWSNGNYIDGTPTIILNGYTVSSYYDLSDMRFFLKRELEEDLFIEETGVPTLSSNTP